MATQIHESVNSANLKKIRNLLVTDYVNSSYCQQAGNYDVEFTEGRAYIRIVTVSHGQRSCGGFICKKTGNLLKSASWAAPAKNFPRGHIDTVQKLRWTGVQ